jgi:hypothetical protein
MEIRVSWDMWACRVLYIHQCGTRVFGLYQQGPFSFPAYIIRIQATWSSEMSDIIYQ